MRTFVFPLLTLCMVLAGCEKDSVPPALPDCWNPNVPDELLEPDTNSCLTDNTWEFYQIWLGGSSWNGSVEHPLLNTYPHLIQFDKRGFYYVVYHGDTVQSGRFLTHDFPYPFENPPPLGQTVEFVPNCVESDTFLIGIYAMQCAIHTDTSGILMFSGQYYLYGGYDRDRLIIYKLAE